MSSQVTKEKIADLTDKIAQNFQPEKIILFGSQAWGEPDANSDIDLFVIKNTAARRIDRAREVRRLIWSLGLPVDILVYTQDEVDKRIRMKDFFISDIIDKGRVLYSAK